MENNENTFNFTIDQLVDRDAIALTIRHAIADDIKNSVSWKVKDLIATAIVEELKPEIDTIVAEHKQQIINAVLASMPEVAKALSEQIATVAVKNITGYSGNSIVKTIFG